MRVVHFGIGAIGRGFIVERLVASGHEVTVVDVNTQAVQTVGAAGGYDVYWIDQQMRRERVSPLRALPLSDSEAVITAVAEADVVTTAVWASNLRFLAPILLSALEARERAGRPRLQVIPCENAVDNGRIFAEAVLEQSGGRGRQWLDGVAGFASTVVDRMVFDAPHREGVAPVEAGDSYELVIHGPDLADPETPLFEGAYIADSLTPYLERKLFVINGGHARAAYLGALRGFTDMRQVYSDPDLLDGMRRAMRQAAALITHDHGVPEPKMEAYVNFALSRWTSTRMPDAIARVGRSPVRKLAPGERLVAPALRARDLGLPHDLLLEGIAAGLLYRSPDDEEARLLEEFITSEGLGSALSRFCGIDPRSAAGRTVLERAEQLNPTAQPST